MIDVQQIRKQFPLLQRKLAGGASVVYFDNAATTLKPQKVIDAVVNYMANTSANIHRGKHVLSEEASEQYEAVREKVALFINARVKDIIFVRGTTEAVNTVAVGMELRSDDNVVGTVLEHHSNILPWSSRCQWRGARLLPNGLPDLEHAEKLIDAKTRMIAVTMCSNVTGVVVPVEQWVALAKRRGVPILLDAAQALAHRKIDVQKLGCDFLVGSGHKMFGPTGSGFLYGPAEKLMELKPMLMGGGTVVLVREDGSYILRDLPWRLEAGTPDIASVIGLGAAIDFINSVGIEEIEARNHELGKRLIGVLREHPQLRILGWQDGAENSSIGSFAVDDDRFPPDYFTRVLSDTFGIMARGGHHCAHPLHDVLKLSKGSVRISAQFYNTEEELAHLGKALHSALNMVAAHGHVGMTALRPKSA